MYTTLIAIAVAAGSPRVGTAAPEFAATDTDGKPVVLSELLRIGPVILAFFPKAFTGG